MHILYAKKYTYTIQRITTCTKRAHPNTKAATCGTIFNVQTQFKWPVEFSNGRKRKYGHSLWYRRYYIDVG